MESLLRKHLAPHVDAAFIGGVRYLKLPQSQSFGVRFLDYRNDRRLRSSVYEF